MRPLPAERLNCWQSSTSSHRNWRTFWPRSICIGCTAFPSGTRWSCGPPSSPVAPCCSRKTCKIAGRSMECGLLIRSDRTRCETDPRQWTSVSLPLREWAFLSISCPHALLDFQVVLSRPVPWRNDGPSGLLNWKPPDFHTADCVDYGVPFGGCVGAAVDSNGDLFP